MAKDVKKQGTGVETSEENVLDVIKKGNLLQEKNVADALAEIEKETNDKKKEDAKSMILQSQYNNLKALLQLRSRRREEKATKEYLTKTKRLLDSALAGKITPAEYKVKKDELKQEMRKQCADSDNTYQNELKELHNSYAGRYAYWWD